MNSCSAGLKNRPRQLLLALVALGMSCFSECAATQMDLPDLLSRPSSTSKTVSVNQLLSSDKSLRSVSRARELLIEGRLDKAQKEITKALKESPNCALAIDIQGVIHMRAGNFDDAANEFQRTIELDPTIGQPYVGLGIILISRGRFKEALVPLDRARSHMPTTWLVYFESAIAYLQLGDIPSTLKQISDAERLAAPDPEKRSANAYLQALASIKQQDYESATRYLQEVIKQDPAGPYVTVAQTRIEQMKPLLDASKESLAMEKPQP